MRRSRGSPPGGRPAGCPCCPAAAPGPSPTEVPGRPHRANGLALFARLPATYRGLPPLAAARPRGTTPPRRCPDWPDRQDSRSPPSLAAAARSFPTAGGGSPSRIGAVERARTSSTDGLTVTSTLPGCSVEAPSAAIRSTENRNLSDWPAASGSPSTTPSICTPRCPWKTWYAAEASSPPAPVRATPTNTANATNAGNTPRLWTTAPCHAKHRGQPEEPYDRRRQFDASTEVDPGGEGGG